MIGFGEVGIRFSSDLHDGGASAVAAFDVAAGARDRAASCAHVALASTAAAAAGTAEVVILAVTAGSVLDAIEGLGEGLVHRPFVLDVNSVSPTTKRAAAERIEALHGRYVEAAVMTSVSLHGLRSPMLLGGPHVEAFRGLMAPFHMRLTPFSERLGAASSVKMCRSIMIKGLEALATESMLSARHYGVETDVLASLADTLPDQDWPSLVRYMISRALLHGGRRSEEMREVAETVRQAGLEPVLSTAIAERQAWSGERGRALDSSLVSAAELGPLLDAIVGRSLSAPGSLTAGRCSDAHRASVPRKPDRTKGTDI